MKIIKIDSKEYLGKWIALKGFDSKEDILCFDEDLEKVKQMAKEKGCENPFLMYLPEKSIYVH